MKNQTWLPAMGLLVITAGQLRAEDPAWFQASLTPDIAVQSRTTLINGLSLNIWGENPQHGLTIGAVNGSTGESSGFTWGLVNYSENYNGVQWGAINVNYTSYNGWQSGWVNVAESDFTGLQSAWIGNYARSMKGLQVGAFNYTEHLNGVQIGIVNVARNNDWFTDFPDRLATGFPILNWSF